LSGPSRTRVHSQLWLITALHFGIELFAKLVADRLPPRLHRRDRRHHPLRCARAADQLGRVDPQTPRV
jgi:hypothetical protein